MAILTILAISPQPLQAQGGLPAFRPLNPAAASRTGLAFIPYREPGRGWRFGMDLDYGSLIESNRHAREYLLDAEVMRLGFQARRDLGSRYFVDGALAVEGSYAGWMDGFFNWYHGVLGLDIPERNRRPRDAFAYTIELPGGTRIDRSPVATALGDIRIGAGRRHSHHLQSYLGLSLPAHTGPDGYGTGTVAIALVHSVRLPLDPGLTWEGSLGTGWTPRHGDLAAWQRRLFLSASSGMRLTLIGRFDLFGNLFYHTPHYEGTGFPALDRHTLSLDFGGILRTRDGREWHVGMTEDLAPSGPSVDAIFRVGTTW